MESLIAVRIYPSQITLPAFLQLTLGFQSQTGCEELFPKYDLKHNIDILHAVVTEARARKQSGEIGKDVWREDLQPRTATRARTIPLLEKEAAKLRATLDEVCV